VDALERIREVIAVGIHQRDAHGGISFYSDGALLGVVRGGRVYLRTDERTREPYLARGMRQLLPAGDRLFYELPDDVLDDPPSLRRWLDAALAS
jgi:TfoX/Sxy family transcriptional regulator of competence genes